MKMVEIVHPTQKELYNRAVLAIREIQKATACFDDLMIDRLDAISFYLESFPPCAKLYRWFR